MSARTTTPRETAVSSAFSSSGRSNRKMTMSIAFLALRTALSTGARPSSGWMISFTAVGVGAWSLALGFLLVDPLDGAVAVWIELQDGVGHAVGAELERHLHIVADLLIR